MKIYYHEFRDPDWRMLPVTFYWTNSLFGSSRSFTERFPIPFSCGDVRFDHRSLAELFQSVLDIAKLRAEFLLEPAIEDENNSFEVDCLEGWTFPHMADWITIAFGPKDIDFLLYRERLLKNKYIFRD